MSRPGRRGLLVPLSLLLLVPLAPGRGSDLRAQQRQKEVECSFLLLSGCRNYVIRVVRIEPGGTERVQPSSDSYLEADPDTLDRASYLVLKTYDGDRLTGRRSVIWVERASGAVGGDWPSKLVNDAVRSAELAGVPGDVVELHDDRTLRGNSVTRMVIFAGANVCRTAVNLEEHVRGGCTVHVGARVTGKVSGILIKYRATAGERPEGATSAARDGFGSPRPRRLRARSKLRPLGLAGRIVAPVPAARLRRLAVRGAST